MSDARSLTYGDADLLIDDGETTVWSAPVSLLGSAMIVSLFIAGPMRYVKTFDAFKAHVTLAARTSGGEWEACGCRHVNRSGADNLTLQTLLFDAPAATPDELRLDVEFQGNHVTRLLSRPHPEAANDRWERPCCGHTLARSRPP